MSNGVLICCAAGVCCKPGSPEQQQAARDLFGGAAAAAGMEWPKNCHSEDEYIAMQNMFMNYILSKTDFAPKGAMTFLVDIIRPWLAKLENQDHSHDTVFSNILGIVSSLAPGNKNTNQGQLIAGLTGVVAGLANQPDPDALPDHEN